MKILAAILTFLLAVVVQAVPVCVDGVCYPSEEAARADGVSEAKLKAALSEHAAAKGESLPVPGEMATLAADGAEEKVRPRVAVGYMKAPQMIAFLS